MLMLSTPIPICNLVYSSILRVNRISSSAADSPEPDANDEGAGYPRGAVRRIHRAVSPRC